MVANVNQSQNWGEKRKKEHLQLPFSSETKKTNFKSD
jgi:hypothetical protein